jgi:subtilisin family serine protease
MSFLLIKISRNETLMKFLSISEKMTSALLLAGIALIVNAVPVHAAAYVENQVIVRFDQKTDLQTAISLMNGSAFSVRGLLVENLSIFSLDVAGVSVSDALKELRADPQFRYAQADHILDYRDTPDDTDFGSQWALNSTNPEFDPDINAPEAWDLGHGGVDALGNEIVIAIVDNGCQVDHPDLIENMWVNPGEIAGNGVDDDSNGYIDDINGWDVYNNDGSIPTQYHGTHVSGIAGARGNNANQICGVNWNVEIMFVAASSSQTSVISAGYSYVIEAKELWLLSGGSLGANVVVSNSSFGVNNGDCQSGEYPIWNDLYNELGQLGILSAAATMNNGSNVDVTGDVPTSCSSDWLVTVTSTTDQNVRYAGAAYGLTSIDLGAPGRVILSTYPGNLVNNLSGTSMATPHVAGAVAFIHSVASLDLCNYYQSDAAAAALEFKNIILGNVEPIPSMASEVVSGGKLNLYQAAIAANQWSFSTPEQFLRIARMPGNSIELNWDSVEEALEYHVESKAPQEEAWTRLATLSDTMWTDSINTAESVKYYRIIIELNE